MTLLIAGLILWSGVHFIPSLATPFKQNLIAKLGNQQYRLLFSAIVILSIVLMVFGWRNIEIAAVYQPPVWGARVTGLLMLLMFILFSAAHSKTRIKRFIRHPQLTGLIVWSIAHLLANGDNRSLILFGGLGIWAIIEILLINKREGLWVKPEPAALKSEAIMLLTGLAMFAVLLLAHPYLFGVSPIVH